MPVPSTHLDRVEQEMVTTLETEGIPLRNKLLLGMPAGPSRLDHVVEVEEQAAWLRGVTGPPDITARVAGAREGRSPSTKLTRLLRRDDAPLVLDALALYLERCVPEPQDTQGRFWSVTALPSTGRRSGWHRLAAININNVEALVLGATSPTGEGVGGFVNLAASTVLSRYRRRLAWEHEYRSTGPVISLDLGPDFDLRRHLDDPHVLLGARQFALGLMKRGTGLQARYHDASLADVVFERMAHSRR